MRENAALALQVVRFSARVTAGDFFQLHALHDTRRDWARSDVIHVVDADVDLSAVSHGELDDLRLAYRTLQSQIDFYVLRRSGWVCLSLSALPLVKYWLQGRHSHDGQGTELILAGDYEGLSGLFAPEELEAARSGTGFMQVATI